MPLGRSDYFLEIEQALLAYGRAAGVLSSTVGLGRAREKLVSDGLRPHLPGRISIERGEMVDGQGKRSGEVDTVLVDTHRACIQVGAESLVPVEAAIAAIEVKTEPIWRQPQRCCREDCPDQAADQDPAPWLLPDQ